MKSSILSKLFAFFLFFLLLASPPVFAFQGEMGLRVLLPEGKQVHSDLYLLGWRVTVQSEVHGNLFVLGGTVRVHGPVHGDVYLAGGNIEVDGPVDGDINLLGITAESKSSSRASRALALDVTQEGKTRGDFLAFGGMVDVQTQVQGDTLVGGGEVVLRGEKRGRLVAIAQRVNVAGKIKKDARIKANTISVENPALFEGNLTYTSPNEIQDLQQRVRGTATHNFPSPRLPPGFHFPWLYLLSHKLFSALWLTVVGLVSLTWFPRSSQSVVDTMLHFPWESFFMGLALFIALPGLALILVVSLLGIPLGIFLFAIFAVSIYLTRLFGSLYIGERLLGALEHHMPPYWQSLPLGVFLFTVLTSIPYLGIIVSFVVIPLALGAKALLGWRVYRRMRQRHLA